MFGLKISISQSEQGDEFDSVSTILSHSSVSRSLPIKQAPPWITSIEDSGGIFHLELPPDVEARLVYLNIGDGGSVSSLALGLGCNSEDTGYSSDQDLSLADHNSNSESKLGGRKKISTNRADHCNNGTKIDHRVSRGSGGKSFLQVSASAVHEPKKNFVLPLGKSESFDQSWFDKSHVNTQAFSFLEGDDGVCLTKSDFRSSKISSISSKSNKSDSVLNNLGSKHSIDKSLCKGNIRSSHKLKDENSLRTSFASRLKLGYKSVTIDIHFNQSKNYISWNDGLNASDQTLCERLLGIVPAHREDFDSMGRGHSVEIIVKGVLTGSPASLTPGISVGNILHSVNGQEITWDNMDTLLSSLSKLKKIKLTMKSQRTETSPVELETLVNILTSDTIDHHAMDKVAAMYISLEGVDPDSSDSSNNGMVYSFPNEKNSLHQLLGLFYTLSHLVKDISNSNTIKNTTLILNGQKVHVAYLQEGNDILVFAIPTASASVHQINTLLLEFSQLLRVLFGSIECVFKNGLHSIFIDNILTYLFRQVLSAQATSSLSSSLSSTPDLKKGALRSETCPFVRYSQHVQAMTLPDELMTHVGQTLSEFESSNFADMSDNFYGCRRQYTILGSAFFYCGQLVCSHLAPEDLIDLHLYLGHIGILDLMSRSSVAQFVAWKEIFPTRFCHNVAEINNNFGYSEPSARWCWLIVGLKHGLFCSLLERISLTLLNQNPLSPDVFYVDQAKACLLKLQTPQLLAVLNTRVNKDSQSPVVKSDYCATYVNMTGEKVAHIFSDEGKMRTNRNSSLMLSLQSNWSRNSIGSDISVNIGGIENVYKSPHGGKMYPSANGGTMNTSLTTASPAALSNMSTLHKISTSRYPSVYQYCCLDGMEGTIIVGSDMDSSGIFHAQIVSSFYQCCRQIHSYFLANEEKQSPSLHLDDDDNDHHFDPIKCDPHLRRIKEHGILMTFNPHQGEKGHRSKWLLEYWVVGRRMKHPSVKETYVCFHASSSQSVVELAFRLSFGSFS